ALATIKKHRKEDVPAHLILVGEKVKAAWTQAAAQHGLNIGISDIAPLAHFRFDYPNAQAIRTLYTQLMLERGILATGAFYATHAHKDSHLNSFRSAVNDVFGVVAEAIAQGNVESQLKGPVAHSGFK